MNLTFTRIVAIVLVAAGISFAGAATLTVLTQDSVLEQTRANQCKAIDDDHNRERNRIIRNERLLYAVPEFRVLIPTKKAEDIAYRNARKTYYDVRSTRPSYCEKYHHNPVPRFPSERDFEKGAVAPPPANEGPDSSAR
jgi:hypothetical protein